MNTLTNKIPKWMLLCHPTAQVMDAPRLNEVRSKIMAWLGKNRARDAQQQLMRVEFGMH